MSGDTLSASDPNDRSHLSNLIPDARSLNASGRDENRLPWNRFEHIPSKVRRGGIVIGSVAKNDSSHRKFTSRPMHKSFTNESLFQTDAR